MTRSLSGAYAIQRTDNVPKFFTVSKRIVTAGGMTLTPGTTLLAPNAPAPSHKMVVGIASKQTPFGQGKHFVLSQIALRRATTTEVLTALGKDHPAGENYRPPCIEINYLTTVLEHREAKAPDAELLALATGPRRDAQIELQRLKIEYANILRRWRSLTKRQLELAILSL